ncbi:MAG: hypothetical protein ACTMHZ_07495 [Bifidobacterium psychraerophilum]
MTGYRETIILDPGRHRIHEAGDDVLGLVILGRAIRIGVYPAGLLLELFEAFDPARIDQSEGIGAPRQQQQA